MNAGRSALGLPPRISSIRTVCLTTANTDGPRSRRAGLRSARISAVSRKLPIPAIKAGKKILRSPNALLEHYRGANGMKTGFICASGLIMASAERNGRTLIAVVLGATSSVQRTETAARLLNDAFDMWFAPKQPTLASFQALPSGRAPVNMREEVCGKQAQQEAEASSEGLAIGEGPASALVPRFVLMEPVPVFTGNADPLPGAVGNAPDDMPMPRLRPRHVGDTASLPLDAVADSVPMVLGNPN